MKQKERTKIRRKQTKAGIRWYPSLVHADGSEDGLGGFKTQREAKAAAAEALVDVGRNRYVRPDDLTVGRYLVGEWLESRENADVSVNTRDVERTIVEAWIAPHIGGVPLQETLRARYRPPLQDAPGTRRTRRQRAEGKDRQERARSVE